MKSKLTFILAIVVALLLLIPYFIYWWGLSNIDQLPTPSTQKLNVQQKSNIWSSLKEYGDTPKIEAITPYGYIMLIFCEPDQGLNSKKCSKKYPGIKVASRAIRNTVREKLDKKISNLKWQITWVNYTIWVTQNWNINQILSTYHEQYGA